MIVDIDLHHGDGTESTVRNNENIMYFSMHQEDSFPGTGYEDDLNIRNIVVTKGTSEEDYIEILCRELGSILSSFGPNLIGVSAGFDAYCIDRDLPEIGNTLNLTLDTYECLFNLINPIPFFAVLEGGYDPETISDCVLDMYNCDKFKNGD